MSKLSANLRRLAEIPSQVAKASAKGLRKQIIGNWNAGKDVYGKEWEPLVEGGKAYLKETEDMQDSLEIRPMQNSGIYIAIDDPYIHHHYGTANMVSRKILPENTMPKTWNVIFEKAYAKLLKERSK